MKLIMVMITCLQVRTDNHNFNNRVVALVCVRNVCWQR